MLFLHSAYELNKAVWPVGHLRIVLTVREPNAFTGRLGRLLLVDCEFVEFGYEPFVFIDYVSRCHDSLLVVGPRRLREWCYAFIDFHKIEKAQGWRSDGFIARAASGRAPRPRFPRLGGKLVAEHGQPAHRRGPCRLVLHHIPLLRQESGLDPQDVARDPVRWSAVAGASPVRDDIVPFGHDQVRLVPKRRGSRLDEVE